MPNKRINERTALLHRPPTVCTGALILSTFIPCLAGFLCGYDQTVIEAIQTLPDFQSHFYHDKHLTHPTFRPLDSLTLGYFSMAILGSLISGYVCGKLLTKQRCIEKRGLTCLCIL